MKTEEKSDGERGGGEKGRGEDWEAKAKEGPFSPTTTTNLLRRPTDPSFRLFEMVWGHLWDYLFNMA